MRFGLIVHPLSPPDVYLDGAATRTAALSRDHQGPRAVLNALGRLAADYASECARIRQDLGIAEAQLRDYQVRLGQPFPHESYLSELTSLRDRLKIGLSGMVQENGDPIPDAADIAARIKALRADHTVDATVHRTATRSISAEEPVTARLRRRTEMNASGPELTEQQDMPVESSQTMPDHDRADGFPLVSETDQTTHRDRLVNRSPSPMQVPGTTVAVR